MARRTAAKPLDGHSIGDRRRLLYSATVRWLLLECMRSLGSGDNGPVEIIDELLRPGCRNLPDLAEREVQVFALHAGGDAGLLARAYGLLSPAERERAGRIRVDGARDEFAVGRAALRVLLGFALRMAPEAVPLETGAGGKPFVPGVYSNVSHSRSLIYVALCRSAAVGVDVEWVDRSIEALEIAEASFAPEETARLAKATVGAERALAFYTLWTRKEAVAKADGRGLMIPLAQIRVAGGSGGLAWISRPTAEDLGAGRTRFHVQELSAPPGFVASLAVEGGTHPVRFLADSSSAPHFPGVT